MVAKNLKCHRRYINPVDSIIFVQASDRQVRINNDSNCLLTLPRAGICRVSESVCRVGEIWFVVVNGDGVFLSSLFNVVVSVQFMHSLLVCGRYLQI